MAPCAVGACVVGDDVEGVRGWCVGDDPDVLAGAATGELPEPPHPVRAASSTIAGADRRQWVTPWTLAAAT